MKDFNRKVENASARVNKSVAEAADRMEKETAEFIAYLNDEVVPAVRQHSTKALRIAAEKCPNWPTIWTRSSPLAGRAAFVRLRSRPGSGCAHPQWLRRQEAGAGQHSATPAHGRAFSDGSPPSALHIEASRSTAPSDTKARKRSRTGFAALSVPAGTKPLSVETGKASWYGAPYHNRRGSNGEIYDMNQLTAAHRTLPLGSIVRVTNLKTGHSAIVRITDRGPFVEGRIIDLSLAAAKQVDVWQAGVAQVRLEVLRTPVPFDHGGRWAVQIGSFPDQDDARVLANRLTRRYRTAKVLSFGSPVGDWWVRVRVLQDDRQRAEEVARDTQTSEGKVFLVRLD